MRASPIKLSILILVAIAFGHLSAVYFSLYWKYPATDIILHTLAGVMFGLFWLSLVEGKIESKFLLLVTMLTFAMSAAYLWEAWEFMTYELEITPIKRAYTPLVSDVLSDIFSSFIGGLFVMLFWKRNK